MVLSIRSRLLFLMMVMPLMIMLSLSYISYSIGVARFKVHLEEDLEILSLTMGESLVAPLQFDDKETAKSFLETVIDHHDVYRICLYAADGKEFLSLGTESGEESSEAGLDQVQWNDRGVVKSKTIFFDGKREGSIVLYSDISSLENFQDTFAATLAGVLIVTVVLMSVLSLWLKKIVTDPLVSLSVSTKVLAKGDLKHRIDLSRKDEFGQLAQSFNEMAMELEASTVDLRRAHDHTRDILDSMQDVVFVCARDWRIKSVNRYGKVLLQCDLLGASLKDYLILEDGLIDEVVLSETHDGREGGIREQSALLKRDDGEMIEVGYSAKLLSNKEDFVLVARDIRVFKKTQQQLLNSSKMASLGELVAGIAHELNNALNFVVGSIPQLERDFELIRSGQAGEGVYAKARRKLERLKEGGRRSTKIIQALKSFSHTKEGEMSYAQVNDLLRMTLDLIPGEYRHAVTFIEDFSEVPEVLCRADELNQVFINILVNASQAIEGEGEVRVSTRFDGSEVEVVISDTGVGIDSKVLESVFDPFFTTKEVGVGTGLGLSISHGIIERHNGSIRVESTRGKGSRFVIRLKVA